MNRSRMAFAATAACLLIAGCELPTDNPILEQRWIIPIEETTLSVNELLPDGVTISGSNFAVSVDNFSLSEDLGTLCALCIALNLTTAPKPAFNSSFTVIQSLPADVESATITSGNLAISITHALSFDPIRPPGGSTGTVTVIIKNGVGGPAIGQVLIDGAAESFAPGTTLNKTLTISAGSVGRTLELAVDVVSPAGGAGVADWVPINTSNTISATGDVTSLLVSSATVSVASTPVDLDPVELDVGDIDEELTERIQQGTLILDIVNPFGVSVTGTINIGPTSKSFSIGAGATSTTSISYTGAEIGSFLGVDDVTFSGSGTASGGSVTVSPGQEMLIEATLDFTIRLG